MKVFSLPWVAHRQGEEDVAIQSISLSSCGTRFATGGLDSKVKVWSFLKLFSCTEDPGLTAGPSLLAALSRHSSAVHSVRFSFFGQYLASGGADGRVIVYHLLPGEGEIPLGSTTKNHENWKVFRVYQQALDVSEVAWGPESRKGLLASASFDTTVNVYDVEANTLLLCLKGHTHLVKGLCWDPLGQFLASQAEQEGVYVWDLSTGACLSRINKHLTHSTKSFDQSRLDWGPTGRFIAAAVGFDNPCFVVPLFARDKWDGNQSLVGHQALVTVAKYNPRLFYSDGTTASVQSEQHPASAVTECIALGSADATFSVWLSHTEVPILRGKRFCTAGITDLAWSHDGYTLLCSSLDGRAFGVNFLESELGTGVSQEMNEKLMYGAGESARAARRTLPVPESAEQLMMEKRAEVLDPSKLDALPIQPPLPSKVLEEVIARETNQNAKIASSPQERSEESPDVILVLSSIEADLPPSCPKNISKAAGDNNEVNSQETPTVMLPTYVPESRETRDVPKEGSVGKDQGTIGNCQRGADGETLLEDKEKKNTANPNKIRLGADNETAAHDIDQEMAGNVRRPSEGQSCPEDTRVRKKMRLDNRVHDAPGLLQNGTYNSVPTSKENSGGGEWRPKLSEKKKGIISCQKEFSLHLGEDENGLGFVLEVINESSEARISLSIGKKLVWKASVKGAVIKAGGNVNFVVISTKEGFILVYDNLGRNLLHYVRLSAPVCIFKTDGKFLLLALLSDAHMWIWDISSMACVVETTVDVLGGVTQVSSVSISQSGRPVAILKNRDAYVFNPTLKQWALLVDSNQPYPGYLTKFARECVGEVGQMQMSAGISSRPPSATTNPIMHMDYLEANMGAARSLDSPEEFIHWCRIYLRTLVSMAGSPQAKGTEEAKLRKVCMELLGFGDGTCSDFVWAAEKLGLDKNGWVQIDILLEVGRNRELQRFREELEGLLEGSKT